LRRWPKVKNRAGFLARGHIKKASIVNIELLSRRAALNHWSAQGRPVWLKSHRENVRDIYVTFLHVEAVDCFKCSVLVVLNDGSGGHFSVDISSRDFRRLESVRRKSLVQLAHAYIYTFRNIKLDPAQAGEWEDNFGG